MTRRATFLLLQRVSASADPEDIELAFWQSVEASGDAAEYQAYLDRYPQGTFAALAQARIMSPPAQRESAPETQAVELAFWDTVKESDDPKMFEAYLAKYPKESSAALLRSNCSRSGPPMARMGKAALWGLLRSRLGCHHWLLCWRKRFGYSEGTQ
jgi:hypothetical protein